jgi:Asp-tRNA(Asn)/Glu-tRNA(Gln) amidotransferase A subunit family amidase
MRKLLGFISIIGVVGLLVYSLHSAGPATRTQADARKKTDTLTKADKLAPRRLGAPVPQPEARKKTDTDVEVDAEQAAIVKVMKAAIAARHGGILPKTVSDEDARVASQAAVKWQAKQAAER